MVRHAAELGKKADRVSCFRAVWPACEGGLVAESFRVVKRFCSRIQRRFRPCEPWLPHERAGIYLGLVQVPRSVFGPVGRRPRTRFLRETGVLVSCAAARFP